MIGVDGHETVVASYAIAPGRRYVTSPLITG